MSSARPDLSATAGWSEQRAIRKLLEIDRPLLKEALALETAEGGVLMEPIKVQPCVILPYLRQAEDAIAEAV
jgi:hypothetical protein